MLPDDLQLVATVVGVVGIIVTIVATSRHNERVTERRLVRIETFLMLCCDKLDIPTDRIND